MLTFRKFAVVFALSAACAAAGPVAVAGETGDWSNRDRNLHFGVGFVIGSAVTADTGSPRKGVLAGVTIGVLKEFVDNGSRSHSTKDALAAAMGAIAGSYVTGLIVVPGAVWYRFEW
ncbi:MAG: hypothetical protein WAW02_09510 [Sideroxyarcus sp.]